MLMTDLYYTEIFSSDCFSGVIKILILKIYQQSVFNTVPNHLKIKVKGLGWE